jgi:YHS domain-containing protein
MIATFRVISIASNPSTPNTIMTNNLSFSANLPGLSTFKRYLQRPIQQLALALVVVSAVGCSAMQSQNPGQGYSPVNAVPSETGERLMLKGHDVVNYFTQNKHAMGSSEFKSVYKGVTFQFASAEHKKLFEATPEKYLPQYGGYCANGVAYGIPWGGDADTWAMSNGKLYIFGGAGSRDAYLLDVASNQALADKYWADEIANSNSFIQRSKRMVFKVPHYKSGEELANMVAAAKGPAAK